ncbi:MAG: response regulator [Rhodospirillaceae bacterium]
MGELPKKILIVDDEPQIRKFLSISLRAQGYLVLEASTGVDAVTVSGLELPDLVVLDLSLPDIDGLEAISRLRGCCLAPIVVMTVRTGDLDKIEALDCGADDYVTKPFGINELMTRIRILLSHSSASRVLGPEFRSGDMVVDLEESRVFRGGNEVLLTRREFETLRLLVKQAGKVLTHQQILREVWGPAHIHETQYLRIHIGVLRQKLESEPARPRFIVTEPAVGYRFQPAEEFNSGI